MSGDKIPNPNTKPYLLEIPSKIEVKKFGRPYVKIWINEATSQKSLALFIKKQWPNIQDSLQSKNRRKRMPKHPDLIVEIFELETLPTSDLYELAGIKKSKHEHFYRHDLMAKILMLKGPNAGESVRKILVKYKKRIRAR